jgi:hypothetical protein
VALRDILCIVLLFIIWNYWKEIVSLYSSVKATGLSFIQRLRGIKGSNTHPANSTEELEGSYNSSR